MLRAAQECLLGYFYVDQQCLHGSVRRTNGPSWQCSFNVAHEPRGCDQALPGLCAVLLAGRQRCSSCSLSTSGARWNATFISFPQQPHQNLLEKENACSCQVWLRETFIPRHLIQVHASPSFFVQNDHTLFRLNN